MINSKLVLQLLILLFSSSCVAQVVWEEESQSARMDGIIQVEDVSMQELYERSKVWMTNNITSSNKLSEHEQDSVKQLTGHGNVILSGGGPIKNKTLDFNITLYFKDGRLKYVINQLVLMDYGGAIGSTDGSPTYQEMDPLYEKQFKKGQGKKGIQLLIDEKLSSLINSLTNAVNKQSKSETEGW